MTDSVKGALLTMFGGMCWGVSGCVGQYLFTRQGMDSTWAGAHPAVFGRCDSVHLLRCAQLAPAGEPLAQLAPTRATL